jgi:hypothetical protein
VRYPGEWDVPSRFLFSMIDFEGDNDNFDSTSNSQEAMDDSCMVFAQSPGTWKASWTKANAVTSNGKGHSTFW